MFHKENVFCNILSILFELKNNKLYIFSDLSNLKRTKISRSQKKT